MDLVKYNTANMFLNKIKEASDINNIQLIYTYYKDNISDPDELILFESLIDKDLFNNKISVDVFLHQLSELNETIFHENVTDIIDQLKEDNMNTAQINTLNRIYNKNKFKYQHKLKHNRIKKNCPHCNREYIGNEDDYYAICGYSPHNNPKGYDHFGCQRDWCFRCGKKLCKNFQVDELFIHNNRIHNKKCCSQRAKLFGMNYNDFCQCWQKKEKIC